MKQLDAFDHRIVQSSSLAAVGYDTATSTLEIEFTSGAVYRYTNVGVETVRELLDAPSMGRYFVHEIKGRYPYARIKGEKK